MPLAWVPEWDPEDQDSRHYLNNGFVGMGEACDYLNPGTDEWARKHIALQLKKRNKN